MSDKIDVNDGSLDRTARSANFKTYYPTRNKKYSYKARIYQNGDYFSGTWKGWWSSGTYFAQKV